MVNAERVATERPESKETLRVERVVRVTGAGNSLPAHERIESP
jgi:hypothetical protein